MHIYLCIKIMCIYTHSYIYYIYVGICSVYVFINYMHINTYTTVCYTHTSWCSIGSKPAYISSYIHKLLPSCASLSYEEQVGLINGKLLMLHSHTGEKLKLDQVCCTVYDISIMWPYCIVVIVCWLSCLYVDMHVVSLISNLHYICDWICKNPPFQDWDFCIMVF